MSGPLRIAAAVALLLAAPAAAAADLEELATRKAVIVASMHKKASRALANAAQDGVFAEYFQADPQDRPAIKRRIDALALGVQAKFRVAEMCLIDREGREISRIVGNRIAPDHELSADEMHTPFFASAFAKPPRQVHIADPYLSHDAHAWTVAYATPIEWLGRTVAILHYEVDLDQFRRQLDKEAGAAYVLAVDAGGHVLSDSRGQPSIAGNGSEDLADYFPELAPPLARLVGLGGNGAGRFEEAGRRYRAAWRAVETWTVVVVAPDP